jgi:hypothetical protein
MGFSRLSRKGAMRDPLVPTGTGENTMGTLAQEIQAAVQKRPGVTDRWLAEMLFGPGAPQQRVNGECRRMADLGLLDRTPRPDGLMVITAQEKLWSPSRYCHLHLSRMMPCSPKIS